MPILNIMADFELMNSLNGDANFPDFLFMLFVIQWLKVYSSHLFYGSANHWHINSQSVYSIDMKFKILYHGITL